MSLTCLFLVKGLAARPGVFEPDDFSKTFMTITIVSLHREDLILIGVLMAVLELIPLKLLFIAAISVEK